MGKPDKGDKCLQKAPQKVPIIIMTREECSAHASSLARLLGAKGGPSSEQEIAELVAEAQKQQGEALLDLLWTLKTIKTKLQPIFPRSLEVVFHSGRYDPYDYFALVEWEPGIKGWFRRYVLSVPGRTIFSVDPWFSGLAVGKKIVFCILFDSKARSVVEEEIAQYARRWQATDINLGLLY